MGQYKRPGYNGNDSEQNQPAALAALTGVLYHGVEMDIQLPAYNGPETVSGGVFEFNANQNNNDNYADTTQIVAAPEPGSCMLGIFGVVAILLYRPRIRISNSKPAAKFGGSWPGDAGIMETSTSAH